MSAIDRPAVDATVAEQDLARAARAARSRILTVLFVGVFMAALDSAIIAPAIPALRLAFGVDNRQIGLVTIVFSLCSLSATALMANLSDRFGRRAIYLLDIALFAAGSLLIARSTTFGALLIGRAIQGLGAGGITPTASAVVGDMFPPAQRGKILGLIGATFGMAFLVGPVVASVLLVWASWQWIFLVNLPVAAIVFVMGARALPSRTDTHALPKFDAAGMTVLVVLLTSLMLGINRALDQAMATTLWPMLLAVAAVGVPVLIVLERRAAQPIVPMTLFRSGLLRTTWVLCVGAGFGMGSVIFITSVAVAAFNTPSNRAGLLLLPLVLCSAIASAGFGRYLNRLGARVVMLSGFGALATGSLLIGIGASQFGVFMLASLFIGTGVGIVVGGTLRTVVLDAVDASQRGAAQALVNIMISVGNLLVVAVLSAFADHAGGGLPGLQVAYLTASAVMLVMMVLSVRLTPTTIAAA